MFRNSVWAVLLKEPTLRHVSKLDQTPEWHGLCPSPGDSGQEKKQWHEDRSNLQ